MNKIVLFILMLLICSCSVRYINKHSAIKIEKNIHKKIYLRHPKGIKHKKQNFPLLKSGDCSSLHKKQEPR
jgi:hypothetical protein